jgi:molecular chaperone GrpE (heat shock protein)
MCKNESAKVTLGGRTLEHVPDGPEAEPALSSAAPIPSGSSSLTASGGHSFADAAQEAADEKSGREEPPSAGEVAHKATAAATPVAIEDVSNREVLAEVDRVRQAVALLGERSRADQDLVARMQARIEALQADQVRTLLGPVITELAGTHAAFIEASRRDYENLGAARLSKEFALLGDRIEGALDLLGAISIGAKPGEAFDSRRHTAVRQTTTNSQALDKTIAEVLRQGFLFQHDGKVALYARVAVYRYEPAPSAAPETPLPPLAVGQDSPAGEMLPVGCAVDALPSSLDTSPFRVPFEPDKE